MKVFQTLLRSRTGISFAPGRRLVAAGGHVGQRRCVMMMIHPPPAAAAVAPGADLTCDGVRSSFAVGTTTSSTRAHSFSSVAAVSDDTGAEAAGPSGDLFLGVPSLTDSIGPQLVGRSGQIERTFGPRDNAQALLVTGGEALAAHASFDPDYDRASTWIQNHAVGPASLSSPVLVSGLIGALVEAAFPQSVPRRHSMEQVRPLIVGVAVKAQIHVRQVSNTTMVQPGEQGDDGDVDLLEQLQRQQRGGNDAESKEKRYGYEVTLDTKVVRVRDDAVIAKGEQVVWIPDYLRM